MLMMEGELQYGRQTVPYTVKRTRRKTLGVYIYPDHRVQFRVPMRARRSDIDQYIEQCSVWVFEQLERIPKAEPVPVLTYQTGELHPFLGQNYALHIEQGKPQSVDLSNQLIRIRSLNADEPERSQYLLKEWYRQRAEQVFADRLAACWPLMARWCLNKPSLRLRWMKSRWGSCSRSGEITLNVELVKYSESLIDYVLLHELCHLREFNHSSRFYAMMDEVLPDWKVRKQALDSRQLWKC